MVFAECRIDYIDVIQNRQAHIEDTKVTFMNIHKYSYRKSTTESKYHHEEIVTDINIELSIPIYQLQRLN